MVDVTLSVVRREAPLREGEDVPIQAVYTENGAAVAPDGASTGVGPTITVTAPDGTDVVAVVVMTEIEVGTYEYVWDTAADTAGGGRYVAAVTAELSGETDIEQTVIEVE